MILEDEITEDMLIMDGYDECIVGIVERFGQPPIICYDRDKVIAAHMKEGMDYEEAEEFFEFNQIGAWLGESTPCFITMTDEERA
jgi:hypothetical protein